MLSRPARRRLAVIVTLLTLSLVVVGTPASACNTLCGGPPNNAIGGPGPCFVSCEDVPGTIGDALGILRDRCVPYC